MCPRLSTRPCTSWAPNANQRCCRSCQFSQVRYEGFLHCLKVRELERGAASGRAELEALRGKHEQVWVDSLCWRMSASETVVSSGCLRSAGLGLWRSLHLVPERVNGSTGQSRHIGTQQMQ